MYASLFVELGATFGHLKTRHLELLASGSAAAQAQSKAEAAELAQLRRENNRLMESEKGQKRPQRGGFPTNEVMRKASAFFAQWAAQT